MSNNNHASKWVGTLTPSTPIHHHNGYDIFIGADAAGVCHWFEIDGRYVSDAFSVEDAISMIDRECANLERVAI